MPDLPFWIDINLPPRLAAWIDGREGATGRHLSDDGHARSADSAIFGLARGGDAVPVSKDIDFKLLLDRSGPPPRLVWVRTGNTSTAALIALFESHFGDILRLLASGESLVELTP